MRNIVLCGGSWKSSTNEVSLRNSSAKLVRGDWKISTKGGNGRYRYMQGWETEPGFSRFRNSGAAVGVVRYLSPPLVFPHTAREPSHLQPQQPESRGMLQSFMLPRRRFQLTPASLPAYPASCMHYPRAVRNNPLRRESAAETTSWVPGPRNAFLLKLSSWADYLRRRPTGARPAGLRKGKCCIIISAIAN